MCAINPKRQQTFTLTAYTAHDLSDEVWQSLLFTHVLEAEVFLNTDGRIRWHLTQEQTNE